MQLIKFPLSLVTAYAYKKNHTVSRYQGWKNR